MDPHLLNPELSRVNRSIRIQETLAGSSLCSPVQCLGLPQETPGHYELLARGLEIWALVL